MGETFWTPIFQEVRSPAKYSGFWGDSIKGRFKVIPRLTIPVDSTSEYFLVSLIDRMVVGGDVVVPVQD